MWIFFKQSLNLSRPIQDIAIVLFWHVALSLVHITSFASSYGAVNSVAPVAVDRIPFVDWHQINQTSSFFLREETNVVFCFPFK